MRLSELSRAAGVSPATVKWYLRIGLLSRGEATAVNQAHYGQTHLHRLRLIRALVDVGGLSTEAVGQVLSAIDDPGGSVADVLAVAHRVTAKSAAGDATVEAVALVDQFIDHRGWEVPHDSPARRELATVLDAIAAFRPPTGIATTAVAPDASTAEAVFALMDPYADAVEPLAAAELANTPNDLSRDQLAERVVAGTILLDRALTALRRMAQESYATDRYRR